MQAVIDILVSLGVNETVYAQFAIFIVTFCFLKFFIFSPYLAAYEERRRRTVGHVGVAKELQQEIAEREAAYAADAKKINDQIAVFFEEKRKEALQETSTILAEAHSKTQTRLNDGKKETLAAYTSAKEQLKTFVPDIGQTIKQRLLDR